MEPLFDNLKKAQENKFEIIGKEHQLLQLVLFPGESIETYSNCFIYMSPNIKKRNRAQGLKDSFMNFLTNVQGEVEFYNDTETIGYIGISRRIGKIIVLNAIVNNDICFKAENLLAHTPGMTLDKKQKFMELGLRTWNKYKPATVTKNRIPQIYLQSSHGLIEKELAPGEEIVLNNTSVFAFSATVKFSPAQPQHKHYLSPLVKAKGPGMIYIENRHETVTPLQTYKKGLLPMVVFWIYLLLSVLLWHVGFLRI